MKLNIKKGDMVQVIAGNDKSTTPRRVLLVDVEKMRVLVEGVNIRKKHSRPSANNQNGGIIEKEMPIHYSNVMLIDSDKKATRVGRKVTTENGKRVVTRIAKTNNKVI